MRWPISTRSRRRRPTGHGRRCSPQRLDPEFADEGRDPERVLDYVAECIDRPGFATTSPEVHGLYPGRRPVPFGPRRPPRGRFEQIFGLRVGQPRRGPHRKCLHRTGWPSVIGYPETAAGTLTSGGSIANLTAIVAAREARDPDGGGAVYTTRFAHYCIDKALHIAGRGRSPRSADRDRRSHRMSVEALDEALAADVARRHPPMAGRRIGRDGRHRRDRSAAGDRRALPQVWRLDARRRRLWRPVRALRRGPRAAPRHRSGGQRRARSAQDVVPPLWHRRRAGSRRPAPDRRFQRERRVYPPARASPRSARRLPTSRPS